MEITSTNNSRTWATADIGIAASAMALGHLLVGVNRDNPRRVLFLLADVSDPETLTNDYWSHNLLVDAYALIESMKSLKGRLYGG